MALQPNYSAFWNLLNPQPQPKQSGIDLASLLNPTLEQSTYADRPVFEPTSPVQAVQPSYQPSIASLFGETIGRAATNERSQFARQDQAQKVARDADAKKLEADKKRRAKQDEFTKKAEDIRKQPKVKRDEALIGGLIALLGAAGGATNAPQSLQNYLGGVSDRRTEEQNTALTALERQMQSELGMMDDQANADQLQGKYALQDIEKFMGRAEFYDKGFKGVDKARADKKEEAKKKTAQTLSNYGKMIELAKNTEEAQAGIKQYNDFALKNGLDPLDEPSQKILMQMASEAGVKTAQENRAFNASYKVYQDALEQFWDSGAQDETAWAELERFREQIGVQFNMDLPIPPKTPSQDYYLKAAKVLTEKNKSTDAVKMAELKREGQRLENERKQKAIGKISAKQKAGKATTSDIIYKDFLEGNPIPPEELKTYLKDQKLQLDKAFKSAASTDKKWNAIGIVEIRERLEDMTAFLGPDHEAVKQAFARAKHQNYLDPKYKGMDHTAFSKYWRDGKANAKALGELFQKKKSAIEPVNGYQKVERNGKQVIRTGNGIEYPLGVPYVWGGESSKGADCSGIVCMAMSKSGIKLPRTTAHGLFRSKDFLDVSGQMYNPDDLLFFDTKSTHGKDGVDHVAVYIGNGMMFHSPSKGKPSQIISVDKYLKSGARFLGARRHNKLK